MGVGAGGSERQRCNLCITYRNRVWALIEKERKKNEKLGAVIPLTCICGCVESKRVTDVLDIEKTDLNKRNVVSYLNV